MIEVQEKISLAAHTIYKIGGQARFFVSVENDTGLGEALDFARGFGLPFFILGAGSNILVSDKGFDGLVIHFKNGIVEVKENLLIADAGVMMARAVRVSAEVGLTGFEWAIGVPGTIGGSVRGNAGCFGGEIKDVVEKVSIFNSQFSKTEELDNQQCQFGYRDSFFKKHPEWIILRATLNLKKGDQRHIQEEVRQITAERAAKQDIGTKSCGCIFKNVLWMRKDINREKLLQKFPELVQFSGRDALPASFLIDCAGLKGRRVGKMYISPKHGNYFINEGGATAEEVIMLIGIAKDTVRRKFGVLLEEEIQYVGF